MRPRVPASPVAALFVVLAAALGSVAVIRGYFDPDYFWHLATGRLILDSGSIPTTDPFSFTWFGEPWISDQWLAQVLIAGGIGTVGGAGMLLLFGAVAALGPLLILETGRRFGTPLILGIPLTILVAAVLLPQVTLRPQVLSFAFLGAVLVILVGARSGSAPWLWLLPALMVMWANTHGFFVIGLGAIAVYVGATLAGETPMGFARGRVAAIGLICLAAAALTPQGPNGIVYALSFLDPTDVGARQISEWQSPDFHNPQFVPFLFLIATALMAGLHRAPRWLAILAVAGLAAGLFASRAIGIGAILAMPAILVAVSGSQPRSCWEITRHPGHRRLELGVALLVAVIVVGAAVGRGRVEVDARRVPVAGTAVLARDDPDARVLADYAWGGYVLNELHAEGGRVFVDGRMHKYAPDVLADYLRIVNAEPGWSELLDAYGVEAILLPPGAPLARAIGPEDGWCEVLLTERELLLRPCEAG